MPTFLERPVTWLFWIATALVIVVGAIAVDNPTGLKGAWLGVALGPAIFSAVLTVDSTLQRLLRGALIVVAFLATTTLIGFYAAGGTWVRHATIVSAMQGATAAGAIVLIAVRRMFRGAGHSILPRRVPLVEFFGWTILVAILSATLRHAEFKELMFHDEAWVWLGSCAVAGFTAAPGVRASQSPTIEGRRIAAWCGVLALGEFYMAWNSGEMLAIPAFTAFCGAAVLCRGLDAPHERRSLAPDDAQEMSSR